MRRNNSNTPAPVSWSRLPVGSSARRSLGLVMIALEQLRLVAFHLPRVRTVCGASGDLNQLFQASRSHRLSLPHAPGSTPTNQFQSSVGRERFRESSVLAANDRTEKSSRSVDCESDRVLHEQECQRVYHRMKSPPRLACQASQADAIGYSFPIHFDQQLP